jgi:hypothetical protein
LLPTLLLRGSLASQKPESESARQDPESKMFHTSTFDEVSWADLLNGKAEVLGELFKPKPGFQEAPRAPPAKQKNVHNPRNLMTKAKTPPTKTMCQ